MLVVYLKQKRKLKNTRNWNGKICKNWNKTETEKKQFKTKLKLKNISQLKSHCYLTCYDLEVSVYRRLVEVDIRSAEYKVVHRAAAWYDPADREWPQSRMKCRSRRHTDDVHSAPRRRSSSLSTPRPISQTDGPATACSCWTRGSWEFLEAMWYVPPTASTITLSYYIWTVKTADSKPEFKKQVFVNPFASTYYSPLTDSQQLWFILT